MRKAMKAIVIVVVVIFGGLLYFADNIRGYYRFKEMCGVEGGLRVYHPLKKGVGWMTMKHGGRLGMAQMKDVAFVRYADQGLLFDMRYRSGPLGVEASYEIAPADETKPVVYELRVVDERLAGERRTSRSGYEVREIASDRLMLRWYQIAYSTFDQDKTLLAAPSAQACHAVDDFFSSDNYPKYFAK